ncbi:hypothetical protein QFZ50_001544 [Arthrobacter agilis]|nr:hypothetical protein [Arthrobacter agilis]
MGRRGCLVLTGDPSLVLRTAQLWLWLWLWLWLFLMVPLASATR